MESQESFCVTFILPAVLHNPVQESDVTCSSTESWYYNTYSFLEAGIITPIPQLWQRSQQGNGIIGRVHACRNTEFSVSYTCR
jgi:hypothetical protein